MTFPQFRSAKQRAYAKAFGHRTFNATPRKLEAVRAIDTYPSDSWWIGKDRAQLSAAAKEQALRMNRGRGVTLKETAE
jgi:hypothetical protein